jgi:hypothetical protein
MVNIVSVKILHLLALTELLWKEVFLAPDWFYVPFKIPPTLKGRCGALMYWWVRIRCNPFNCFRSLCGNGAAERDRNGVQESFGYTSKGLESEAFMKLKSCGWFII